jgi:leucine dehydrogenase
VSIERETPLVSLDHEELVVRKGRRSGLYTIVAVHSTALGPSLGGCRLWRYADTGAGTRDALRLARAMTFKAAAAGLSLGGGKGVICAEPGEAPTGTRRRDLLLDFADTVNVLEGQYRTAEDVGTSSRDMALIATETKWVTGLSRELGGSGDPSPFTALGVESAIRACCQRRYGSRDLDGRSIAVVGLGHVGSQLVRRLTKAGARVIAGDINPERRSVVDKLPNATWADPSTALLSEVDVLAPCALGSAIDEVTVRRVRCDIVCGAANNQLAHDGLADDLAARDIVFAPDYIANAGGLINISIELDGYDPKRARERVAAIEQTMGQILDEAEAAGITPLAAANDHARRRLAAASGPAR